MKIKYPFIQNSSNIYMQNKLLVMLVGIIALSSIWDSIQISNIKDTQETIILPYGDVEPYRVRHNSANIAYVEDMAQYIVFLYSNHSAGSVRTRFDTLLTMFHESTLPRYKSHLNNMADDYSQYSNISHVAHIDRAAGVELKENYLTIHYKQNRITGQKVQPPKDKTLSIEYKISNGRFWIMEMSDTALKLEENS
ncbi:MAG: TraE/TraK family type IV conjugative transfer system protein [Colwellia sp.]